MATPDRIERRMFLAAATGVPLAMSNLPSDAAPGTGQPDWPPADLDALEQSVQGVLTHKRLGQPVFVRYTLLAALKEEERLAYAARMADAARRWLGQALERAFAVGSVQSGPIHLTLQFRQGATALVCLGSSPAAGAGIDLMVVGNHGALYHDAGLGQEGCAPARYKQTQADPYLTALIERALRSGKPEAAEQRP
jgi:hypothetical protein